MEDMDEEDLKELDDIFQMRLKHESDKLQSITTDGDKRTQLQKQQRKDFLAFQVREKETLERNISERKKQQAKLDGLTQTVIRTKEMKLSVKVSRKNKKQQQQQQQSQDAQAQMTEIVKHASHNSSPTRTGGKKPPPSDPLGTTFPRSVHWTSPVAPAEAASQQQIFEPRNLNKLNFGDKPSSPVGTPPDQTVKCRMAHTPGSRAATLASHQFDGNGKFVNEEPIGVGSFGCVYKAQKNHGNGVYYAIKVAKEGKQSRGEAACLEMIASCKFDETQQTLAEGKAHVVKYYDEWSKGGYFYIQMELCQGLAQCGMKERLREKASERKKLLSHILKALRVIHHQGWCHLDIKPTSKSV
jgi:hypothetical protein